LFNILIGAKQWFLSQQLATSKQKVGIERSRVINSCLLVDLKGILYVQLYM